jgi:hypothetical protein
MAEQTVEEYLKAQQAEWSVYVATEVININGARAFNPGDPVPASHVERGVVTAEQVAKITTKAGREAAGVEES